jgi:hypothetical protein
MVRERPVRARSDKQRALWIQPMDAAPTTDLVSHQRIN